MKTSLGAVGASGRKVTLESPLKPISIDATSKTIKDDLMRATAAGRIIHVRDIADGTRAAAALLSVTESDIRLAAGDTKGLGF